ncbi:MAG: ribbon-helix-helix domain-containing protein [Pseudomonadota bacterium]
MPDRIRKRSVIVSGHRTSVSLEGIFWGAMAEIATERGLSINQLVTEIDRENPNNLSSAIRVYVLQTFRERLSRSVLREPS